MVVVQHVELHGMMWCYDPSVYKVSCSNDVALVTGSCSLHRPMISSHFK